MSADTLNGTILIRGDALLPRSMEVESHPYSDQWRRAVPDRAALDHQISVAKWSFFFLAGELKATVLGSGESAVHRAVVQILKGLEPNQFNCLEITQTKGLQVMGLSLTTVTAHSRHIQESNRLLEPRWNQKLN